MEIVLYHMETDQIRLYRQTKSDFWLGLPYVVWRSLEIAISYDWEVIGEL